MFGSPSTESVTPYKDVVLLADSALFPTCFNLYIHFYLPHTVSSSLLPDQNVENLSSENYMTPEMCPRHRTYFKLKWPGVVGRPQQILPSTSEIFDLEAESSEKCSDSLRSFITWMEGRTLEEQPGNQDEAFMNVTDTQSFSCASQGCE